MVTRLKKIATKKVLIILAVIWAFINIYECTQYMLIRGSLSYFPSKSKYEFFILFQLLLILIRCGLLIASMIKLHSSCSKKLFLASFIIFTVISALEAMLLYFLLYPLLPIPYGKLLIVLLKDGALFLLLALAFYHKPLWAKIACIFMAVGLCFVLCLQIIAMIPYSMRGPLSNFIVESSRWPDLENSDAIFGNSKQTHFGVAKLASPNSMDFSVIPTVSEPIWDDNMKIYIIGDNKNDIEDILKKNMITNYTYTIASHAPKLLKAAPSSNVRIKDMDDVYRTVSGNDEKANAFNLLTDNPYEKIHIGAIESVGFGFVGFATILYCAISLLYLTRSLPSKEEEGKRGEGKKEKEVTDTETAITVDDSLTLLKELYEDGSLNNEENEVKKAESLKTDE